MSKSPCRLPDRSLAIADRSNRPDAAESPCPRLADPYIQAHEYCLAENEDRLAMPRKSLSAPLALVALVMPPAAVQAAEEAADAAGASAPAPAHAFPATVRGDTVDPQFAGAGTGRAPWRANRCTN